MRLPDTIQVHVCCSNERPIEGIIIELIVKSGIKNPYSILLPKTDIKGYASISKKNFIGQFEDHWVMGVMDYNGSVKEAEELVLAKLYDQLSLEKNAANFLAWPLLKNESSIWESREQKYNYLKSCSNRNYKDIELYFDISKSNCFNVKLKEIG